MRGSRLLLSAVTATAAVAVLGACGSAHQLDSTSVPAMPSSSAQARAVAPAVPAPANTPASTSVTPTRMAEPKPVNHCASNTYDQLVLVRISVQHMWLCHFRTTVYSNPITTGMTGPYTRTPTGNYRIQGLNRNSVLTLNSGAQYDVKYWIPFNAPLFGFHDSSWQHFPYGSPQYKTAGSHGCVHMPLTAIAFLYHWARIGAHVSIS